MNFLFSDAISSTGDSPQGNPYSIVIMLITFGFIFYFMIFRPQKKRANMHKELIFSIKKGDEILTTGGLIGRVTKVIDTGYLYVALNETNEVIIKRDFVTIILPKDTMKSL